MTLQQEYALKWVKTKFAIFPVHTIRNGQCSCGKPDCHAPGKHPMFKDWRDQAVKAKGDEEKIKEWWRQWPDANIGCATGLDSGIVVVDVDVKPDKDGKTGFDSANQFLSKKDLETTTFKTGSGGLHLVYVQPPDMTLCNRVRFLPGLDIRADGGYIVMPGSVHASGGIYEISNKITPILAPPHVLEVAREESFRKKDYKGGLDWTSTVHEGEGRNSYIAARFGALVGRARMPLEEAVETVRIVNERNCVPPLDDDELNKIVSSIWGREQRKQEKTKEENKSREERRQELLLPLLTVKEFAEKYAENEERWLIENWLPKGAILFQVALPECYKSWTNLALAVSIATGEPFMGLYPIEEDARGSVIYINLEDHFGDILSRLYYFFSTGRDSYDPETDEFVFYPLKPLPENLYIHDERSFNFKTQDALVSLENQIKKIKPKLVVIDPLYKAVDVDNYMEKAPLQMDILKTWRDKYDCSFVIAHHAGKNDRDGRARDGAWGSVLLNAFQEQGWQYKPVGKDATEGVTISRNFKNAAKPPDSVFVFNVNKEKMCFEVETDDPKAGKSMESDSFRVKPKNDPEPMEMPVPIQKTVEREAKEEKLVAKKATLIELESSIAAFIKRKKQVSLEDVRKEFKLNRTQASYTIKSRLKCVRDVKTNLWSLPQ